MLLGILLLLLDFFGILIHADNSLHKAARNDMHHPICQAVPQKIKRAPVHVALRIIIGHEVLPLKGRIMFAQSRVGQG